MTLFYSIANAINKHIQDYFKTDSFLLNNSCWKIPTCLLNKVSEDIIIS